LSAPASTGCSRAFEMPKLLGNIDRRRLHIFGRLKNGAVLHKGMQRSAR
jgi:hypothetical protein